MKLSSLGDILHTLPAVTDAAAAVPGVRFDWVVEEAFAEVPGWHPAVARVIPVALRRWRRRPWRELRGAEWSRARAALGAQRYDKVIDAQGLLKSAVIARLARGPRYGMDGLSARECLAGAPRRHAVRVPRDMHAVDRLRLLFARALVYPRPAEEVDYGLPRRGAAPWRRDTSDLVFIHGSARGEKLWPLASWIDLAARAAAAGYRVSLPWGDAVERDRAERIAGSVAGGAVGVLPRLTLSELGARLARARAAVAVDTGPGHLCAALGLPTVSLYGPTQPELVGTRGPRQRHLVAGPGGAMASIDPAEVWGSLQTLVRAER